MRIDQATYAKLPEHLRALFQKLPNLAKSEVLAGFPESESSFHNGPPGTGGIWGPSSGGPVGATYSDFGSAARFFYCAKASKADRYSEAGNDHPTVKPEDLIRYLIRLITPPGGTVLDPFLGSGTTAKAAKALGFKCIGIDLEERHCEIAAQRLFQEEMDLGPA